ncbi:hypothetical protein [Loigolactobacillus zhaoyuanensis]|uniref:hypothetical protein n=1 Tax=Loigolactobacillus zhaoyuanensis TaxID=2486017 RepID=UPI000F73FB53|nr:hypothetical protein [Loigolactobacillus zhaoyuanensis]
MQYIKSRKQGTSIVLTVPAEFNIETNIEYEAKKLPDGTIQFTPVQSYPEIWNDDPAIIAEFNQEIGLQDDGGNYGRENTDY